MAHIFTVAVSFLSLFVILVGASPTAAIDPGCVKTCLERSKRKIVRILKNQNSMNSMGYMVRNSPDLIDLEKRPEILEFSHSLGQVQKFGWRNQGV